jgi:chromosome segregation ATPase
MEAAQAALNATLAERDKTIEALNAKVSDLTGQIGQHSALVEQAKTDHTQALADAAQAHEATKTELKAAVEAMNIAKADLIKARAALADPAFADAAARGQEAPPADGGLKGDVLTDAQFAEAYDKEPDPANRAKMWRERNG